MKKLLPLLILFVLVGAGCSGSNNNAGSDGGILKSTDAGLEWVQANVVPTAAGIGTLSTSDVINMEIDPSDTSYLYVATRNSGMLYSRDSGVSWQQPEDAFLKTGTIVDIEVDPKDVCTVYVAKANRLFRTTDCMRSFNNEMYVESRPDVGVIRVSVDWFNTNVIWIALSNGDLLKSKDAGKTWRTQIKAREEISEILISNSDSRQVLVSTFNGNLYRTLNGGEKWEDMKEGLVPFKSEKGIFDLVQDQKSKIVLAASKYGVLRSKDFGKTWESVRLITSPGQVQIRALALDTINPNTIYYATPATFYHSADGGSTWKTEKLPSTRLPRSLVVDPKNAKVLYIGVAQILE